MQAYFDKLLEHDTCGDIYNLCCFYIYVALLRLADVPVNKLWVVCKQKCEEKRMAMLLRVCVSRKLSFNASVPRKKQTQRSYGTT